MLISAYTSPGDVPAKEWDSLTEGSTIYSAAGWLWVRDEERPEGARAEYFIVRDEDGVASAGMETYSFAQPPHVLYTPALLLDGLVDADRLRHMSERPLVIGAGWSEFRGQLPVREGLPDKESSAAVDMLTGRALAHAESVGASVLSYFYLTREDALEVARAHGDADPVLLFHDVETALPVGQWQGFDDYVSWLPAGRRPRARKEARIFRESKRTIREVSLPDVVDIMAPLNSSLMRKHGHDYGVERARAVYGRQGRFLGESSTLLLAEEDERAVGFALRYRRGDMLYARVAGFDYSAPNLADYFNLVFYHPITQGFDRPTREIHLGLGTFQAKLARGAQPQALYSVFVGVDSPLKASAGTVRDRNDLQIAAFADENGHHVVGGLDTSEWLR
ncbi:peptidogalycan biosysnthesis protein (plasmid) [Streptomyces sp. NBC_01591]|uniref:peptidogalycan biosysnthesis protein n=1 Tax=Streptomyces sp. NBC_01591 TaxID=2975888 RepID=UPI002DDBE59F|nr:peptidogalycan biosysnthesis protein [Streptomyces sp. NBC_01591]WSD74038.1 peptidogalycan biosysnthesis protein [Streptomyces sp. NBC_01591]